MGGKCQNVPKEYYSNENDIDINLCKQKFSGAFIDNSHFPEIFETSDAVIRTDSSETEENLLKKKLYNLRSNPNSQNVSSKSKPRRSNFHFFKSPPLEIVNELDAEYSFCFSRPSSKMIHIDNFNSESKNQSLTITETIKDSHIEARRDSIERNISDKSISSIIQKAKASKEDAVLYCAEIYQLKQKSVLKFCTISKKEIRIYKSKELFMGSFPPTSTIMIDEIVEQKKIKKGNVYQWEIITKQNDEMSIISDLGSLIATKKNVKKGGVKKIQLLKTLPRSNIRSSKVIEKAQNRYAFISERDEVVSRFSGLIEYLKNGK